jgi:4-amino-4-deoxy-L-arabinose transferase-like glycosyltransferase
LGDNLMGVRMPALCCGLLLSLLGAWFGLRLARDAGQAAQGDSLALWSVAAFNSILLFAVGGLLMVHDSLQVAFWVLALMALLKVAETGGGAWWLLFALLGGLGVLSKYTGAFLLPCALLALATHPALRLRLRGPWPWLALALGAAVCSPILIWNAQNGFPSFIHVLGLGGGDPSRVTHAALGEFLGGQAGLATPVLFVLVAIAWGDGLRRRFKGQDTPLEWILWCVSAPVFLFFLLLSLRSRVEANWPAPAWWGGVLLAGLWLLKRGKLWGGWSRLGLGLALLLSLLVYAQAVHAWLPIPASRPNLDAVARVAGWDELGQRVQARLEALPGGFVGAATYQNEAELSFLLPEHPQVLVVGREVLNHQYRFWNHPEEHLGQDAIVVAENQGEADRMAACFQRFTKLEVYDFRRHGNRVRHQEIYWGRGFKG